MQIIRKKQHPSCNYQTYSLFTYSFHNLIFLFSEIKPTYIVQTISTDGISEKLYPKNHKEKNLGEQQTGSKQEKEYVKAVYCHPAHLTYMQSTS